MRKGVIKLTEELTTEELTIEPELQHAIKIGIIGNINKIITTFSNVINEFNSADRTTSTDNILKKEIEYFVKLREQAIIGARISISKYESKKKKQMI